MATEQDLETAESNLSTAITNALAPLTADLTQLSADVTAFIASHPAGTTISDADIQALSDIGTSVTTAAATLDTTVKSVDTSVAPTPPPAA